MQHNSMHAGEPPPTKPSIVASTVVLETVTALRRLTKQGRQRRARAMLRALRAPAVLAAELLTLDDDALIKKVRKDSVPLRSSLISFAAAADQAQRIAQVLKAVEIRLAIALTAAGGEESEQQQ